MAGRTESSSAIASGGHQNAYGGGSKDAFLAKFNASGVRQWGSYYGGTAGDWGLACAADGGGNVYLAGTTGSNTAITSGGHQAALGGSNDAFLVKFAPNGLRQWATYYGGTGEDEGTSCAVDASGNVYLAGITASGTAIASGGHQGTFGGGSRDAFLVAFNATGIRQWGTYYGGANNDEGTSCAVDGNGNVYLAGTTASDTAIADGGHQETYGGGVFDAFLVKFDGDATVGITSTEDGERSFSIWPNPNTGDRFFLHAHESGLAEVQLFDALGKLQRTEHLQWIQGQAPLEMNLGSDLTKGLYLVRITVEGRSSVAPIMIEQD